MVPLHDFLLDFGSIQECPEYHYREFIRCKISKIIFVHTTTGISNVIYTEWKRKILKTEIIGEVPSAINPPSGCRFNNRCPYVEDICYSKIPKMIKADKNHLIACHFPEKTLNITKNLD